MAQDAGLDFTRADVVVSISRGPPGQWFPETEHWASAIFVGTSGIPPKIIYRSVKSYTPKKNIHTRFDPLRSYKKKAIDQFNRGLAANNKEPTLRYWTAPSPTKTRETPRCLAKTLPFPLTPKAKLTTTTTTTTLWVLWYDIPAE